ncbi:hypothetical protein KI387_009561, partial [Taxus chinensis]
KNGSFCPRPHRFMRDNWDPKTRDGHIPLLCAKIRKKKSQTIHRTSRHPGRASLKWPQAVQIGEIEFFVPHGPRDTWDTSTRRLRNVEMLKWPIVKRCKQSGDQRPRRPGQRRDVWDIKTRFCRGRRLAGGSE